MRVFKGLPIIDIIFMPAFLLTMGRKGSSFSRWVKNFLSASM